MSTSTAPAARPLWIGAGLEIPPCIAGEVVVAPVIEAGVKNVAVEFLVAESTDVVAFGAVVALVMLLSVIVNRGGLIVIVDLIRVVVVRAVPALSLASAFDIELPSSISSVGMIQNSSDTNPPLICAS